MELIQINSTMGFWIGINKCLFRVALISAPF